MLELVLFAAKLVDTLVIPVDVQSVMRGGVGASVGAPFLPNCTRMTRLLIRQPAEAQADHRVRWRAAAGLRRLPFVKTVNSWATRPRSPALTGKFDQALFAAYTCITLHAQPRC